MGNSTPRSVSAQHHLTIESQPDVYLATNGCDLVEMGLTLDWMESFMSERCQQDGIDLTLWLAQGTTPPRLIASFRPGCQGRAVVRYL